MHVVIYHNPRCSKSRETLALLREQGIQPDVIEYLDNPPDAATLGRLLTLLQLEPRQLMRQKEDDYAALNLADPALDRAGLIAAMVAHPRLIERPIVVVDDAHAALGRPPENVLALLNAIQPKHAG
ncbi:arsenate reductase (glutaredoxin) [Chitinolyticbacter meiyuanensis]|uniref:arsenate reductase (glutaredoxin) n=1 Tax=Chitinolyticbacter meiyuanensis TaxID=682798 RepID=UPI0011E5D240|nr:arsenate reductase (glutaredoxin) [Chitinolyticbacter meiyuanensis]